MKTLRITLISLLLTTGATSAILAVRTHVIANQTTWTEKGTVTTVGAYDTDKRAYPHIITLESGNQVGYYHPTELPTGTTVTVIHSDIGDEVDILG
jgi:hypothetical protein